MFALEDFISPYYSLELCIRMGISFLFFLPFTSLLFLALYKASSGNHFAFLHFFFLGVVLITTRMISVRFQGKPFNITVIEVYAPTSNAEEGEVERVYEDLQDLLELTSKKMFFSL